MPTRIRVSMAQGGSFETGAFTGAISAGAGLITDGGALGSAGDGTLDGTMARTVVAAAAGGTASVLAGGKFANGAITGAMAQLFNAEGRVGRPPVANDLQLQKRMGMLR